MKIFNADCLEILREGTENSVDSLVCDPPAGISFMGKDWDGDRGGRDAWVAWLSEVMKECYRVLKPGAHGLVWALPRTSHWTATALEDAGFEIRDVVTHLFGTGFPKSMDISKAIDKAAGAEREVLGPNPHAVGRNSNKTGGALIGGNVSDRSAVDVLTAPATDAAKQWAGWGTALKPASEHWILVRKPCSEKTVAANVLKHGVGGLNIDASRIETSDTWSRKESAASSDVMVSKTKDMTTRSDIMYRQKTAAEMPAGGRFPANLVLDEEAAAALDEQSGVSKSAGGAKGGKLGGNGKYGTFGNMERANAGGLGDSGGASRFFYVAKASKSDKGDGNTHPTVKSTALMTYLITLITPPGGRVLDPFMGSGSTGVAAVAAGFDFVGIEKELEYYLIAEARLKLGGAA